MCVCVVCIEAMEKQTISYLLKGNELLQNGEHKVWQWHPRILEYSNSKYIFHPPFVVVLLIFPD